jgi:poly [ADP-ribose] polymerase 6/8
MWHGSGLTRWHSIICTVLRDGTGTALQANGSVLGEGIYLAGSSGVTGEYTRRGKNAYKAPALPNPLGIVALCEVAKVPNTATAVVVKGLRGEDISVRRFLEDHMGMLEDEVMSTCSMENACVVRFLIAGKPFPDVDVIEHPPRRVPTLRDVLAFHAGHAK